LNQKCVFEKIIKKKEQKWHFKKGNEVKNLKSITNKLKMYVHQCFLLENLGSFDVHSLLK
jgi:hypothetical protein